MIRKLRIPYRGSHRSWSVKTDVLKNFAKFTWKDLCQSLFLIKLQASHETLLIRRLWHKCFPVNFAKYLRTPILQNTSEQLLLSIYHTKINTYQVPNILKWCRRRYQNKTIFLLIIKNKNDWFSTNPFYIKVCYVSDLTEIHCQVTYRWLWDHYLGLLWPMRF